MPLLSDIQQDLLDDKPLAPILLKLRYLASRLGSEVLEEWVKFEMDGYPEGSEVPAYRKLKVTFTGSFHSAFRQAKNVPIPTYLVETFGGEQWLHVTEMQSVSTIESLIAESDKGSGFGIDASNLILLLQGNVYPGLSCTSVKGRVSGADIVGLIAAVRSRVLELTIQIEKAAPIAASVKLSGTKSPAADKEASNVTNITNQVIYGNLTSISNASEGAGNITTKVTDKSKNKSIRVSSKDQVLSNVRDALNNSGLSQADLAPLLLALEKLAEAKDKPSRTSAYNHFVAICADHLSLLGPFIAPLKHIFLS